MLLQEWQELRGQSPMSVQLGLDGLGVHLDLAHAAVRQGGADDGVLVDEAVDRVG